MAAPLDEATRGRIYAMFHRNVPTRVIVEETGVSKTAINNMRKAWKERSEKTPVRADGRACDYKQSPTDVVDQTTPTTKPTTPDHTDRGREAMAETARSTMDFVVKRAQEGFLRASLQEDESKRTWAEVQYLKLLAQVSKQAGAWGGLDKQEEDKSVVSPLDVFAEEIRRLEEMEAGNGTG